MRRYSAFRGERLKMIFKMEKIETGVPFRLLTPDMQEGAMSDLTRQEDQAQLEQFLDAIELIIVDNISTLCRGGKENDADGWIPVQKWALRALNKKVSCVVAFHRGRN